METETKVKISENSLNLLKTKAATGSPDISTPRAELFIGGIIPMAGIRLKHMTDVQYLNEMAKVPQSQRPAPRYIVPTNDREMPIVVNTAVRVTAGKTYIGSQEVVLLP